MRRTATLLATVLAACGGSARTAPEPNTAPVAAAEPVATPPAAAPVADEHEHEFPPEVEAFHDVLAPLWHADPGPGRTDNTCAALEDLGDRAEAVATGTVPPLEREEQLSWQQAAELLVVSVEELELVCDQEGRPGFEDSLSAVHDRFHALIALLGHEQQGR